MRITKTHKRHETTRLRDYEAMVCLEVPKSRVSKSKDQKNMKSLIPYFAVLLALG